VESCAPGEVDSKVPFDLVINATSLGHEGKTPTLSKHWFGAGSFCYDMNYGQASVPLQRLCEAIDIPFSDGLGMLVGQAALSFELWTGRSPETGPVLKQLRQTPG
jgi:shikimate dehydrogenase